MPETKYATTRDGASVAYQEFGSAPANFTWFPYLFGHVEMEWEEPGHRWTFERLASFARTVHFDKRGSGLSDPLDRAATLDDRMDDARAVLDACQMDRAFIGGQSEGGPLAVLFAATYPERTDGLVLINTSAGWPPEYDTAHRPAIEAAFLAGFDEILAHWGDRDSPILDMFCPSRAGDTALRDFMARFSRHAMRPSMVRLALELALRVNVFDLLPTLQVPTLCIHERGDRVVSSRLGRAAAERIPGAEYVELDGSDHVWWLGPNRDEIFERVEGFVTGGTSSTWTGDRALATVLFTDIVDSTAEATRLGDAAWRKMLDAHDQVATKVLAHYTGKMIKSTGDGLLATFDSPTRAIGAALDLCGQTKALGVELRAGLHTGEIELRGADIGGIAVHLASRVESCAEPGRVFVSRTVKDLVAGSRFEFTSCGARTLKGIDGTWDLYAVEG